MGFAEDLDLLDKSIHLIQIEWEKFFGGVEKKPPNDQKTKIERLLRDYGHREVRNNTERFRLQTLTARYNTLNELWSKRLRAVEEGKPLGVHGLKADILPPPPPPPPPPPAVPAKPAPPLVEVRMRGESDLAAVHSLFERFIEARQAAGEGAVKFDSFQKLIAQQASRILKEKGAQAVDFRIEIKDGKVGLKAKPVR